MLSRTFASLPILALLAGPLPALAADQSGNAAGASNNEELTWCGCSATDTLRKFNSGKVVKSSYPGRYWWSKAFQVEEEACDADLLMPAFYKAIESQYATKLKSDVVGQCFTYSSRKYLLDRHKSAMSGMLYLSPKTEVNWVEFSPQ